MKYRVIREYSRRYPIRLMCRALAVSAAGYYAWLMRPESRRAVHNRILLSEIRMIHRESRETYGSPSIWDALIKRGHGVGENRIARLMRVEGIRAKTVKKWRATTDKHIGRARQQLLLPFGDLRGVDLKVLCQFGQCLVAFDRRQRHLRLKRRPVIPS